MKKILFVVAAMFFCSNVNATSWRVCSKPEARADFISVVEAHNSNSVFSGDTLYLEPGHIEQNSVTLTKQLTLIGPGFSLVENGYNMMSTDDVVFINSLVVNAAHSKIFGCKFIHGLSIATSEVNEITVEGCFVWDLFLNRGSGHIVRNCFIYGQLRGGTTTGNGYGVNTNNCLIENNIIDAPIVSYNTSFCFYSCIFRNNTITWRASDYIFTNGAYFCQIYNNIIINMDTGFTTTTNNQITDTTWNRDKVFKNMSVCEIHNNVLSCKSESAYQNCVFNETTENVLVWENANTLEGKFMHKTNSPAVGTGVNGTTCGAYGSVNGGRTYQPSGIPQYRPYIYDANIDDTPSNNNTINASFKIKVQQ